MNIGFGQQILIIAGSKAMMEKRSVKLPPVPEGEGSETRVIIILKTKLFFYFSFFPECNNLNGTLSNFIQFWTVPGVNGQVGLLAHKPAPPNFQDRLLQDVGQGHVLTHLQLLVAKNVGIGQWTLSIAISISLVVRIIFYNFVSFCSKL